MKNKRILGGIAPLRVAGKPFGRRCCPSLAGFVPPVYLPIPHDPAAQVGFLRTRPRGLSAPRQALHRCRRIALASLERCGLANGQEPEEEVGETAENRSGEPPF